MFGSYFLKPFSILKNKNKENMENTFEACLFTFFENHFLFSKIRRTKNTGKTCLVSSFFFFFVLKNTNNTKTLNLNNEKSFQRTPFWCFPVFSKKCSQEQF